jgi:DNA polymerase elongation subunit (family B)
MKLFLYASSICPLSTTIKAHSYYHVVLLYCLDKSGRTVVLQPTRYETYIQLEPELESMEGFKNTSRLDFLFPGDVESPHSEEEYKGKFVSKVEIEHKVQLLGFNNSQKVPVLKVSMRNEKSRRTLQYALAKNDNDYGPIKIKQVLHTKIPADTQFLYDTNLQLGSWIECEGAYVPKKVNVDELFDAENVTFLHVQAANLQPCAVQDEPATMRKAYIRIAAHSSTATKTNQYDPSYDIDKDEVRYICLQLDNEKPIVLDIEKCGNTEQGLLEMFGTIMREADVHVLVFSSDERCSPNSLVYLYERSKRYGINLHFSKLKTHEIKCVQRQVGENNMFLDFVHPGVDRVNISEVLKKAQVSPPLDGFRILDALRHEKLIAKDAKPRFKSLLSLNYQGYNFNSTPQQIMEDLKINTNLLATLENNNEFVASQQGIAKICTLSLTSVVERGQQARITNFLFRAFDKNGIYVNDKQLENVYTVIKRMQKNSSFPLPPEINNPDISEMNGEKPPRHVIKCNKLPPHLAFLYDLDHNNVFEPEDPEPDFKELMPNYPKKEFDIIESKAMDYAHILPKFNDMTLLVQDDEDDDEGDKPRKRDVEETQDSKQTGYEKPWWSSKTAADFAPKSKKRKVAPKKRYSGGLVLKPVAGFYIKDEHATATVDWSSLYPSIIIAHLICYMRLIFDKKWLDDPLLVCDYIPITDSECLILAKTYNGVPVQTILPEVVSDVMQLRKDIRAEQKGFEYGSFKWNVFERAQLAAKCVANSLYGFLGSDTSVLPITALAAAVTCLGQFQNKNLKFAFIFAGYLIVYGGKICALCVCSLCVLFVCALCVCSLCVLFVCALCVCSMCSIECALSSMLYRVCSIEWLLCVLLNDVANF